jgi:hypothetical protein
VKNSATTKEAPLAMRNGNGWQLPQGENAS